MSLENSMEIDDKVLLYMVILNTLVFLSALFVTNYWGFFPEIVML